jgi:hypothetical protein
MKKQIRRFSPHQNGKVFGVLMAVLSLFLLIPLVLMMPLAPPQVDPQGNEVSFPFILFVAMPIFYALFGYVSVAVGCLVYNFLYRYLGGFEFEVVE